MFEQIFSNASTEELSKFNSLLTKTNKLYILKDNLKLFLHGVRGL